MAADIYDWISQLRSSQWVLDVGSGQGSFPGAEFTCYWLALDDDAAAFTAPARYCRVVGRSHQLPVSDGSVDLVVCHHALEHLEALDQTLAEMARVLKPDGRCYISIPNGYGLCDAVYRWVFEGGGHVNRFRNEDVVARVEKHLNVRLAGWQKLYSSFVYLRRLMEFPDPPPPGLAERLLAILRQPRWLVGLVQRVLYSGTRLADRLFGSGLSLYGWAFFFERAGAPAVEEQPGYVNVCMYCGTGEPAADVRRAGWFTCRCRNCDRTYPFTRPFGGTV